MKILVLNCGSSSIKFQLFDMTDRSVMIDGVVEQYSHPDSAVPTPGTDDA